MKKQTYNYNMKKQNYNYGPYKCYSYIKTAGNGWEVGFVFGKETTFVGNFIHYKEATNWYKIMNSEIYNFTHKYTMTKHAPLTWYKKFFSHDLYKVYYTHLDKWFNQYQTHYGKSCTSYDKKYTNYLRKWNKYTDPTYYTLKKTA